MTTAAIVTNEVDAREDREEQGELRSPAASSSSSSSLTPSAVEGATKKRSDDKVESRSSIVFSSDSDAVESIDKLLAKMEEWKARGGKATPPRGAADDGEENDHRRRGAESSSDDREVWDDGMYHSAEGREAILMAALGGNSNIGSGGGNTAEEAAMAAVNQQAGIKVVKEWRKYVASENNKERREDVEDILAIARREAASREANIKVAKEWASSVSELRLHHLKTSSKLSVESVGSTSGKLVVESSESAVSEMELDATLKRLKERGGDDTKADEQTIVAAPDAAADKRSEAIRAHLADWSTITAMRREAQQLTSILSSDSVELATSQEEKVGVVSEAMGIACLVLACTGGVCGPSKE